MTVKENSEIVCGLEENDGHVHTENCKAVSQVSEITCGLEEQEGHAHTEACYETASKLGCGYETEDGDEITGTSMEDGENDAQPENNGGETTDPAENDESGTQPENDGDGTASESAEDGNDDAGQENGGQLTVSSGDGAAGDGHVHTDECYVWVLKF